MRMSAAQALAPLLFLCLLAGASCNPFGNPTAHKVQQLRRLVGESNMKHLRGEAELLGWLDACKWDVEKAADMCLKKAKWRAGLGKINMQQVAMRMDPSSFTVLMEPLRDKNDDPIVWSLGLPWGDEKAVAQSTAYLNERVLASTKPGKVPRPLVIIDIRSKSFRRPNKAIIKGGFDVVAEYYPWYAKGATVFLGVPKPIQYFFKAVKPFMPKEMAARFNFRKDYDQLEDFLGKKSMLKEWGGEASWDLKGHVGVTCLKEGTYCKLPEKPQSE